MFATSSPICPADGGRYSERRTATIRALGLGLALAVNLGLLALLVVQVSRSFELPERSAPMSVTMLPLAAPPEPVEEKQAPEPMEKQAAPEPPRDVAPLQPVPFPVPVALPPPPLQAAPRAESTAPPAEPAAPPSTPAPPAPRMSSNSADSWEGRVLARLERYRRYPAASRARRVQGVVHVRFRLRRDGRVLGASIQRSSGSQDLDRAALETLRRAQPLPEIPAGRAEEIELSVPVEFFLR